MAIGFPDSVPAWNTSPSGVSRSMISAGPPNAPTGRPPPITLPSVVTSGSTPSRACTPPYATRKPVKTSSNTSSAPCSRVSVRSAGRKPGSGSTSPMLPTYGSTITHAISPGFCSNAARTAAASLYGTTIVSRAVPAVTPLESGLPIVSALEPALIRNASAEP